MLALIFVIVIFILGMIAADFGLVKFLIFLFAGDFPSAFFVLAVALSVLALAVFIARYIVNDSEYEISEFLTNRKKKRRGKEMTK